jgi:hypothetical protein
VRRVDLRAHLAVRLRLQGARYAPRRSFPLHTPRAALSQESDTADVIPEGAGNTPEAFSLRSSVRPNAIIE